MSFNYDNFSLLLWLHHNAWNHYLLEVFGEYDLVFKLARIILKQCLLTTGKINILGLSRLGKYY